MTTRRDLLTRGAVGLLGGALTVGARSATAATAPPVIRALRSRRAEAKPITAAERLERIERARRLLERHQLDALLLAEGSSLYYYTGISWWGSERLFAAVIPVRGAPFYVCPAFEEGRAREQLERGTGTRDADVRTWAEDESPYARVAAGLSDRGISTGRLGVEENVRYVFTAGVAAAAPHVSLESGTPVTAGCRMIKSPAEIALMRLANEVTLAAYEATWRSLKPGMTGEEISEVSRRAHEALGFEGAADLVLIGDAAAFPHGTVVPHRLAEGSLVLMDGGCKVEGYQSDISRTFVYGRPTERMQHVFRTVRAAQDAALAAARPGVACEAVDAAARGVVEAAGFGSGYTRFTHRLGHGIGLDGHEWPYLVRGNRTPLAAGITTSNEPGIYLPGEFGVRLEDDMLVTESGAVLFTPQSPSLEDPFGRDHRA